MKVSPETGDVGAVEGLPLSVGLNLVSSAKQVRLTP